MIGIENYCVKTEYDDELFGTIVDYSREMATVEECREWVQGHTVPGIRWTVLRVGEPEVVADENWKIVDVHHPAEEIESGVA